MYAMDGEHGGSFSVGLPLNGLGKKMQKTHFRGYSSLFDQSDALCDRSDREHVSVNCSRALSDPLEGNYRGRTWQLRTLATFNPPVGFLRVIYRWKALQT
eukprot:TRINITY_DN26812_c0_g1_i1.p1 TRINITY_DN26812_c0_g1~~TRINITY_DN26812_c0_g1_i1.p1  ORF type:complete len:100 (+),score=7.69 TRINITY_DN26812_c0_g1_i1:180-479(+)